jgi:hypothetical protein
MSPKLSLQQHLALMMVGLLALQPLTIFLWIAGWADKLPEIIPKPALALGIALSLLGVGVLIGFAHHHKEHHAEAMATMLTWAVLAACAPYLIGIYNACGVIIGSLCLVSGAVLWAKYAPQISLQWRS